MFRFARTFSLLALLTLGGSTLAQADIERNLTTVPEIVTAMEEVYGTTQSIQADFVQVTRSSGISGEQRQKGRMSLQRPRKMRWDFTSPESKVFVTDGQTMWIWSPADNQVIVYQDFSSNASAGVATLLTDLSQMDELFDIHLGSDAASASTAYVLEMQPRNSNMGVKHLTLYLDRNKLTIARVIVTDNFDTVTDLTFSQMRLNPRFSDSDFTFSIPAGAQVISPEGM